MGAKNLYNKLLNVNVFHTFSNVFADGFFHLLFPIRCSMCEEELSRGEKNCCSICFSELPYSYFEKYKEPTDLDKLFWGRVQLTSTYALLFYTKNNLIKPLLHAIKYKNRPDLGVVMGRLIGQKLLLIDTYKKIDVLIPVPLHIKKKHIRGYNQSEQIAIGISEIINKPIDIKSVGKGQHTQSQTKFGRFKRWDNVNDLFYVNESILKYQHIVIVDDVITTGATIESLILSIREVAPNLQISVVSLAMAK